MQCHMLHQLPSIRNSSVGKHTSMQLSDPRSEVIIPDDEDTIDTTEEITVSSYNHKFAELGPGYLLLSVNRTHYSYHHCEMIEEWIVAAVYAVALLIVIIKLVLC